MDKFPKKKLISNNNNKKNIIKNCWNQEIKSFELSN